jgi:hypothetical protein
MDLGGILWPIEQASATDDSGTTMVGLLSLIYTGAASSLGGGQCPEAPESQGRAGAGSAASRPLRRSY